MIQAKTMFTTTAYTELDKRTSDAVISEKHFYELVIYFRVSLLDEIDFSRRLQKHRKPAEFINEVLLALCERHRAIQLRPEMSDINGNCQGYVTSSINRLWEEDRTLRSLYATIREYCNLRNKDFNTIAVHIAEYRTVDKLITNMRRRLTRIARSKI